MEHVKRWFQIVDNMRRDADDDQARRLVARTASSSKMQVGGTPHHQKGIADDWAVRTDLRCPLVALSGQLDWSR
jgi:hypothetical protein